MAPAATEILALRESLSQEFPEIDEVCSDRYLSDVLSVPNRAFEYARDEKIRKALLWRREFGVGDMCKRFSYDMQAGMVEYTPGSTESFICSPALLKLCKSRALRILPNRDEDGRIVLLAETQLLDWHAAGVEAGLRYHVLVIEAALSMVRAENGKTPESMVLLVDTTAPLFAAPPPVAALQGMVSLLQKAYPDRINRIVVGPCNFMVRGLYKMASGFMAEKSRHKIKLVGTRPEEGIEFTVPSKISKQLSRSSSRHSSEADVKAPNSEGSTADSDGFASANEDLHVDGSFRRQVSKGGEQIQEFEETSLIRQVSGELSLAYSSMVVISTIDYEEFYTPISTPDIVQEVEPGKAAKTAGPAGFFMFQCCGQRADEQECETI